MVKDRNARGGVSHKYKYYLARVAWYTLIYKELFFFFFLRMNIYKELDIELLTTSRMILIKKDHMWIDGQLAKVIAYK